MKGHSADSTPVRPQLALEPRMSLTNLMRERTHALHALAEQAGIINQILRGRASRFGYALLLRNLLPVYTELERGLELQRRTSALGMIAARELYRASAIRSDLAEIMGPLWEKHLPLLSAGERYGRRIGEAASGDGMLLIAHAYTRYLGDLNGGQVMKRLLAKSAGLRPAELSFFDFEAIANTGDFKVRYRRALDDCTALVADCEAIAAEAETAFRLNIWLAEEVQNTALSAAV